jgi:hypothetical protein
VVEAATNGTSFYSASVPKLFTYQNRIFLYWDVVMMDAHPPNTFRGVTSRGIELQQEPGSLARLWPKGVGGSISANDSRSVEVMGPGPAPRSDITSDIQQIVTDGQMIYATASLGGSGTVGETPCVSPGIATTTSAGCYRMALARTSTPLGTDTLNQTLLVDGILPSNPNAYTKILYLPDGTPMLMGLFYSPAAGKEDALTIAPGQWVLPLPASVSSFVPCAVVVGLPCSSATSSTPYAPCSLAYTSTSSNVTPNGFGAAYNLFSTNKELVVSVDCSHDTPLLTVGSNLSSQYIYDQGYIYTSGDWQPLSLVSPNAPVFPSWFLQSATISLPSLDLSTWQYVVGYVCNWIPSTGSGQAGTWKCGCANATCATGYWQLQAFKH